MLTDPGDFVFDPFGGSCIVGEVAERLDRKWSCAELVPEYLDGALGRFRSPANERAVARGDDGYYRIARPSVSWNGPDAVPLAADGGRKRPAKKGGQTIALPERIRRRGITGAQQSVAAKSPLETCD